MVSGLLTCLWLQHTKHESGTTVVGGKIYPSSKYSLQKDLFPKNFDEWGARSDNFHSAKCGDI